MSLFQCDNCGCVENTALASQGFKAEYIQKIFDWSDIPERKGMLLCSDCGPTQYRDGKETEFGKWHNKFDRTFLPKGMFKTNREGNLEHRETGNTNYQEYALLNKPEGI